MATVRHLGNSPNRGEWNLRDLTGAGFENLVAQAVSWALRDHTATVTVEQTPQSGDQGKDIVVKSSVPINLFGFNLDCPEKDIFITYVECKKTDLDRLDADFTHKFNQFDDEIPDYFILATNSTITPYAFYTAHNGCKGKCRFLLADRYILHKFLEDVLYPIGKWKDPENSSQVVVEYQITRELYIGNNDFSLYLTIRNYSEDTIPCDLRLTTDENWTSDATEQQMFIESFDCYCAKIRITRVANIGLPDLRFVLNVSERPIEITIHNKDAKFDFTPRMFGSSHLSAVQLMKNKFYHNKTRLFINLAGIAGIGKSRVIEEFFNQEAKSPGLQFCQVFFQPNKDRICLQRLFTQTGFCPSPQKKLSQQFDEFLENFTGNYEKWVVVLEDLHHASREILECLKNNIGSEPGSDICVTYIITGRNDFSVPNEDYFSLLDHIQLLSERDSVVSVELIPLSDQETRDLIHATIENAPEFAVEKITALSENTPFYVVQIIEHLLEIEIARLLNRNTVGIPDIEKFNSKETLPQKITEIYDLRFAALLSQENGPLLQDYLLAASFFGFGISPIIDRIIFDGFDSDSLFQTLLGRRFIHYQANGDLTFTHENLLIFLRAYARNTENRSYAAALILRHPALLSNLDRHDRGELSYLAGQFDDCLARLSDISKAVLAIDNFSSENLDTQFYPYLDCLFDAGLNAKPRDKELLRKIVLAKSYMGIHNFALLRGVQSCDSALKKVSVIKLNSRESSATKASIRQLQAHGLLNMGHTQQARCIMRELESEIRLDPHLSAHHELVFDVYDRLQELYKKWNHCNLSHSYGRLAKQVIEESGNEKLLVCHLITCSGIELYTNPSRALEVTTEAHRLAKANQHQVAHRLTIYINLSLILTECLLSRNDRETLRRLLPNVRKLVEIAIRENLPDSLMRAQLLYATLLYYIDPEDRIARELAKKYVEAGLNSSIKYGNGLFVWLLYNLKAIISLSGPQPLGNALKEFATAVDYLRRQSLLFLGNCDACYPNIFVVSNYLRFLTEKRSERAAYGFLEMLDTYEAFDYSPTRNYADLLRQTLRRRILTKKDASKLGVFIDPIYGYCLPVL